jgi:hypothetical protein
LLGASSNSAGADAGVKRKPTSISGSSGCGKDVSTSAAKTHTDIDTHKAGKFSENCINVKHFANPL